MTDYVPYQNGPISASGSLDSDDSLYVASGILITTPSGYLAAAYCLDAATNVQITIDGTAAGTYGIGVGGTECSLYIGSTGTVRGSGYGVYAVYGSTAGVVYNDGRILSDGIGVEGISNSHLAEIHNSGLIQAGTAKYAGTNAAIHNDAGSTGTQLIENSGTIKTLRADGYAVLSEAAVAETIKNSGTMIGTIDLGAGNDVYDGRAGQVQGTVFGGAGNDVLYAGAGSDRLVGGVGIDKLLGGAGADTFLFAEGGKYSNDVIVDFTHASDKIALDNAYFTRLADGALDPTTFRVGEAAAGANDYLIYNSKGQLLYDVDGNGTKAAFVIATLSGHPTISAADILVV